MDPNIKITKKFTKKFGSKVINRQYFHRKTGLEGYDFTYVNVQQTPNPAAQFPSMEPPFDEHSEAVKHVPYIVLSDLAVHWLWGKSKRFKV